MLYFNNFTFLLRYSLDNKLVPFDYLESIFGGGTEIANLPVLVVDPQDIESI